MISNFIGEFLYHPAPIEISGNTCSHNCAYCFANIRKTARYCQLTSVINRLKKHTQKTLLDSLIYEGFPICISNRTDPFSKNNFIQSLSIFQHLANKKNGIFIQTKGGYGIDETLKILEQKKNIVWYITITTIDDELSKKIEPNAPTSSERFALVKQLIDLGHFVSVALNPYSPVWLKDEQLPEYANKMRTAGVNHIIIEPLHLKVEEIPQLKGWKADAIGEDNIKLVLGRKNRAITKHMRKAVNFFYEQGFVVSKFHMPYPTSWNEDVKKVLGASFPTTMEFQNWCYKQDYKNGLILTFDDFFNCLCHDKIDFFTNRKFKNLGSIYMMRRQTRLWYKNPDIQNIDNYKDLLKAFWNHKRIFVSPQNDVMFKKIQHNEKDCLDDNGNIQLYFDGIIPANNNNKIHNI